MSPSLDFEKRLKVNLHVDASTCNYSEEKTILLGYSKNATSMLAEIPIKIHSFHFGGGQRMVYGRRVACRRAHVWVAKIACLQGRRANKAYRNLLSFPYTDTGQH